MNSIQGAVADLVKTEHLVNLKLVLKGPSGVVDLDYRTNDKLLESVGLRSTIIFKSQPVVELVTPTQSDVSYNLRAVHYDRNSRSKPEGIGAIAAIPGSIELARSQLMNINNVALRPSPNVTDIIKPNPLVGHSPRLDLAWSSIGTTASSSVVVIVHCVLESTGSDLPLYDNS